MSGEATGPTSKDGERQGAPPQEGAGAPGDQAEPAAPPEPSSEDEARPGTQAADPKELLNSANAASGSARSAWLAFFGLLAYLMVTLAGVTHVDLLLNSPVRLPIVNVEIPLFSFFGVAPYLLLLVHLSLLIQHAQLAHKYQRFTEAIAVGEDGDTRNHPMRDLVSSYVFAQMLAGPRPPWPLQMLMRLMVFVTFSFLPIVVLLYFQIKFLPSHDVATIHAIRIAILLDLALLFAVRPYVAMPYLRPGGRKLRYAKGNWRWELSYASLALGASLSIVTMAFSLLVATVPQSCFWPFGEQNECFSLDRMTARWWPLVVKSGLLEREAFAPTKWLFEGDVDRTGGRLKSLFSRNLVVTDKDLVEQNDFQEGETSLTLRGRDLRFAVFDRSDLRRADMFDSDLRGASALDATLDHALLEQARMQEAYLRLTRMQGAELSRAQMQGADLVDAQLQGANLDYAQMQGAHLLEAQMQGVHLSEAQMQGAGLAGADMPGAYLIGVQMQGADLRSAQMQGADLIGVQMQGANLSGAQMQGAYLIGAQMQGADLAGARMQGATLLGVRIWQTSPPEGLFDGTTTLEVHLSPPDQDMLDMLEAMLAGLPNEDLRQNVESRLRALLNKVQAQEWSGSPDHAKWQRLSEHPQSAPIAVAEALSAFACRDGSGGYIIQGVARRMVGPLPQYYREATEAIASKLTDKETCPAARHLDEGTLMALKDLAAPAEPEPQTEE